MRAIPESQLPALYRAADRGAVVGQRRLMKATALRLGSLVLAAAFGSFSLNSGRLDIAAVLSATALATALVTDVYLLTMRPDRQWYEARSTAESAKTLAWRYLVGGEPFGLLEDEEKTDRLLHRRYSEITNGIHEFAPVPPDDGAAQVTEVMRAVRALPLDERRRHYAIGRIYDQRSWYTAKAIHHDNRAARWSVTLAAMEALGLVGAVLNAGQVIDLDLPGIIAAAAAAGVAWLQTRQHQNLARSYSVTALELGDIASRLDRPMTEKEWARFVEETEKILSREQMLWWGSHN
ncbi:DUF4231 domain-containing protein [Streptosporangium sp. NPDC023963]|uniref:DUF4231 domain-containing protein n=1 Tax=Streptosporangium sp. NPDC023963 TaxID=3155608 RepID=UPI003416F290